MHRFRRYAALLLIAAGLALTLTACSGSGGNDSGDGSSGDEAVTYTNDEYGFSITTASRFTQGAPVSGAETGGEAVFRIVFADQDGPVVSGRYVNAVQVAVYELAREVTPEEVPGVMSEVQSLVDQLMASMPSAEVVEPLEEVIVNDVPGFAFKYTYTEEDTPLTAVTFFLIQGAYEYQITAQAATEDWDGIKDELEAAIQSFTVQ